MWALEIFYLALEIKNKHIKIKLYSKFYTSIIILISV